MIPPYTLLIGLRYTMTGRNDRFVSFVSLMSTLGIALGVASLIIVLSVMSGFHNELRARILSAASHLEALSLNPKGFTDWQSISDDFLQHNDIIAASPNIQQQGLFTIGNKARGSIIRGIIPQQETQVSDISEFIRTGSLDSLKAGDFNVILGKQLAARLHVKIGDEINLIAPQGQITAAGFYPRIRRTKVGGTFASGLYQFDEGLAYMHIDDVRAIYRLNGPTSVRLKLRDLMQAPAIKESLKGKRSEAVLYDWTTSHGGLFQVLVLEKRVMFIILTLIIAVAAFNIVSALVTMVRNKRGDIAILRAMGATSGAIAQIFLFQGLFIGVAGSILGVLIGYPIAINAGDILEWLENAFDARLFPSSVFQLEKLPSIFSPEEAAIVITTTMVLALLATVYPAWYGSRLRPADALRHEE